MKQALNVALWNVAVSEAWTVFSCDFGVYDMDKLVSGYTLAVR